MRSVEATSGLAESTQAQRLRQRGQHPAPDSYKINYDGALSNANNKSGIGVVLQDCHGEVIASLVQQLD